MKFRSLLTLAAVAASLAAQAQGGISPEMLARIRKAQPAAAPAEKALRNALAANSINALAVNPARAKATDTHFSHRVRSKGITDQKSSGRCWLFTGLNVLRSQAIARHNLGEFQFSQSYCFFYDQLEKSNLFLQSVIDLAGRPMDDKTVDWLFHNPLSDGGTFCGVQDIVSRYGLVPAEVMPETYNANNTSKMSDLLQQKLRQWGLELRGMAAAKASKKDMAARKEAMLATVYRILALCLGEPPAEFTWTRTDADGVPQETKTYTPRSFYDEMAGKDLYDYVMLMNDPTRPYYKTYTIDLDRHAYDGHNWTFLNLPMDEIKQMAIASIKDSTMMYMSCDVGKLYNRETGVLALDNYDYADLFDTDFPMDKAQRISTFASASSHAMTMMAVDLDENDKPRKWMVENSWGPSAGYKGHLIMTDRWLDEYLFRLVVERRFVPEKTLRLMEQKPIPLPAWDPLFAGEK